MYKVYLARAIKSQVSVQNKLATVYHQLVSTDASSDRQHIIDTLEGEVK